MVVIFKPIPMGWSLLTGVLEDEVTHRKLLPVIDFFREIGDWIRTHSLRGDVVNANYISFANGHSFTTKSWTEAYHWQKDTYSFGR